ncbi:winged helix-turn-helix transcriptional regulator [Candidatus Saccharibacteria bacterium]|nr:winged helix-turn-helix transcriptional regulator [Candidatus Saccharibacteria bacterium]
MKFQKTGYTIKQVQQQIHTAMEDALRPLSLSLSQYNVLKSLEASVLVTGAELARKAFVTPQTMHTILMTMERKELIAKATISGNTKSFNISSTDKGKIALKNADQALATLFEQANTSLTSKEYNELEHLLKKLSSGLKASHSGLEYKQSEPN